MTPCILRPLRNPIWSEKVIEIGGCRETLFFDHSENMGGISPAVSMNALRTNFEADIALINVVFLGGPPTEEILELSHKLEIEFWLHSTRIPFLRSPLSEGDRIVAPKEEVECLEKENEKRWLEGGLGFRFDIRRENQEAMHILSGERFGVTIRNNGKIPKLVSIPTRVSLRGILYVPVTVTSRRSSISSRRDSRRTEGEE